MVSPCKRTQHCWPITVTLNNFVRLLVALLLEMICRDVFYGEQVETMYQKCFNAVMRWKSGFVADRPMLHCRNFHFSVLVHKNAMKNTRPISDFLTSRWPHPQSIRHLYFKRMVLKSSSSLLCQISTLKASCSCLQRRTGKFSSRRAESPTTCFSKVVGQD